MFEILGFEKINFTNEATGEVVNGYKLYLSTGPIDEKRGKGYGFLTKFFANSRIEGTLDVGKFAEFKINFNSKGEPKVVGVKIS